MSATRADNTIQAAMKLGFLTTSQLQIIDREKSETNVQATDIAIRRGFLNRQQLDILNVFSKPLSAVPGYRIDGLIGQGGIGVVYRATQLKLDRVVAIKTIKHHATRSAQASKRFEREAQIIGQLRHPNIVSAFDFGTHAGQTYLVMEFVDGIDAEKHLQQNEKLPESVAWHIGLQVCHALRQASESGITHRDIKPGNLILTSPPSGTRLPKNVPFVKVTDFGLARFKDNHDRPSISNENSVSGTPFYMPPEQIRSGDVDHLSDIYAIGITIWNLIKGEPPFPGDSPMEVMTNKVKFEDQWLAEPAEGISRRGFDLLKRMCRYEREHRIQSYEEVVAEVESVVSELQNSSLVQAEQFEVDDSAFSTAADVTFVGSVADFSSAEAESEFIDEDFSSNAQNTTEAVDFRKWLIRVAVVTAVVSLLVGAFLFSNKTPGPRVGLDAAVPHVRLTSFTGPPVFLFNGTDVDPRQKFSGFWELAHGKEGESVLAGTNGTRDLKCVDADGKPMEFFGFSCGFRHNESNRIGFRWIATPGNTVFETLISRNQSQLIYDGRETGLLELEKFGEDTFGYHLFQIESQPDHWRVMLNSELLGRVPKAVQNGKVSSQPIIQLFVDGQGAAHFEQLYLRRLAEADADH